MCAYINKWNLIRKFGRKVNMQVTYPQGWRFLLSEQNGKTNTDTRQSAQLFWLEEKVPISIWRHFWRVLC